MKKQVFLLIGFVLSLNVLKAQIHDGDVTLTTQDEVEAFNYTTIIGSLTIKETSPGAITNIDKLSVLTNIKSGSGRSSQITIENNSQLNDIDGLSNLIAYDGGFIIKDNASLKNIDGLVNIHSEIGGLIWIINNNALQNINGLSNVINGRFGVGIQIRGNSVLKNIDGLKGITVVAEVLNVSNNPLLENIDGLSNITRIRAFEFLYVGLENNITLQNACGIVPLLQDFQENYGPDVNINNNGSTSSSIEDILSNCQTCQGVYNGNVTLTTQTQVDAFNYCEVNGSITIRESVSGDIINLDGLSGLNTITGTLSVKNNSVLNNLKGLSNLAELGRDFILYDNQSLANIGNFTALTTIGGKVSITRNPSLSDLSGFANVQTIGGELYLNRNEGLRDLKGLSSLSSLGGNIYINNNINLLNIDALAGITSVSGNITVTANFKLQTLDGFASINSVGGSLIFKSNVAVQQACGIKQLLGNQNAVAGAVSIVNNGANASSAEAIIANCTEPLTYVPDDNFEQALIDLGYDTAPLDDYVSTANIENITRLAVSDKGIKDLTGIEDFKSVTKILCLFNELEILDVSQNSNLEELFCGFNKLSSLNVSENKKLRRLFCNVNSLQSLDLSKNNKLEEINCAKNKLSYLNIKNANNQVITTVFQAGFNAPGLCIEVDDAVAANNGNGVYAAWIKDGAASYSDSCGLISGNSVNTEISNMDTTLYPVPSNGQYIHVKDAEKNTSYQVVSFSGNIVSEGVIEQFDQQLIFNNTLEPGIYFMRLTHGGATVSKQLVVRVR